MTRKLDDLFGKVCENTGHVKWSNKLIAVAGTNETPKASSGSHKALGICLVLAVLGGAITVALSMKSSGDKVANEISRVQCLAEQNKSEDCELAELIESNAEYRQKIDRVATEVNENNYAKARQLEESAGLRKLSGKESIDLLKKVNGAYAGVLDELIERKIKTVDRAIGEFSGAQGGLARMKALTEICKIDNTNPRITKALSECEEAVSPVMCLSAEIEGRPISDAVFVKDGTLMRPPYRFVFRNYDGWVRFDAITAVYKGFGKTYSAKLCRFKPNWVGVTNVVLRLREDPAAGTVVKVPVDASNAVEMVWCPPGGDVLTYVDPDTNEKKETVRGVEAGFWIARYELDDDLFSALSSQVSMRGLRNEGVARKSNMSSGEKMPVSRKFLAFHEALWRGDLYREGMLFGVPTVGQWIRAARFGGFAPKADDFGKYAWYMENSGESVAFPVGSKSASPLGLFDMYGNVPEWTLGSARKWIGLENSEKGGDEDLLTRMGGGCQDDYEGCMSLDRKAVSCRESSAGEKGRAGLRLSGVSMFMYEESFVEWCGVIGGLASANAETRKAAIERLAGIAKNGGEPQLRGKAAAKYLELGGRSEDIGLQESVALRRMKVAKCDDIAKLSDWACNDEDEEIRRLAFKRIKSPSPQVAAKYLVRVRESEEALLVFAKSFEFGGQKPTADVLALMATNALNANVRSKAVAKVVDQAVLKDVALKDENLHCVYEAIERMTKRSYLMEIKQESKRKNVRDAARERLESLSE